MVRLGDPRGGPSAGRPRRDFKAAAALVRHALLPAGPCLQRGKIVRGRIHRRKVRPTSRFGLRPNPGAVERARPDGLHPLAGRRPAGGHSAFVRRTGVLFKVPLHLVGPRPGPKGRGAHRAGHGQGPLGLAAELPFARLVAEEAGEEARTDEGAPQGLSPLAHDRAHGPLPAGHPAAVFESGDGAARRLEAEHAGDVRQGGPGRLRRVPASRLCHVLVRAGVAARGGAGAPEVRQDRLERLLRLQRE
mmetsp:Transcript_25191/g.84667  ORF Transcript_25191/g.84667 Transcript_25191/m.84667 type:complete len:247 (+) Transcript_25191:11766-12506(+)